MWMRGLILILCWSILSAAADLSLSAKFISGKVEMQKKATGKWLPVRVGAKFKQNDRLRTYASAAAILSFDNGSEIQVQENSILDISELNNDQGNSTNLGIKRGNLLFNIKKLSAQDKFKFETSTATAAIRGTEGGIGVNGDQTLAYLDEGALELVPKNGGTPVRIGPREIAVQSVAGFTVQNLNTGRGGVLFQQLLKDTNIKNIKLDSVIKGVTTLNPSLNTEVRNLTGDSTLMVRSGKIENYESQTSSTQVRLSGECSPGATGVKVGDLSAPIAQGGTWSVDVFWALNPSGPKTFVVFCQYGNQSLEIGQVKINYQKPPEEYQLSLNTISPQMINDGKLIVEGSYVGKDAVLRLSAGNKIYDLSSLTGKFRQELEITDRAGTWNLTKVELNLSGPSGALSQSIDLEIDKSSKKVNTTAPDLSAKLDVQRGVLLYSLSKSGGDPTDLSLWVDGEIREEWQAKSDFQSKSFALLTGVHTYKISALDQAQNLRKLDLGTAEYWQQADYSLEVSLDQGSSGTLSLPPLPPKQSQTQVSDRMRIEILGLPEDNPKYIDEILVVNSTVNFRKSYKDDQIKELKFDLDLPLAVNKDNALFVRVKPKVGLPKEWSQTIQVQR